jgi:hypothetical protein
VSAVEKKRLRLVIIESPYAADSIEGLQRNTAYARAAVRDCALKGESAMASHLLWTQVGILNDDIPEERALGIELGLAWGEKAEATIVYVDLGISQGMKLGIERARELGRPVEFRYLDGWQQS